MASSIGLSGPIYEVHQVPEHFHEHFIISGYRHPKSTATQCILSVFDPTNETLNFWTHFLPSWYFLWILKGLSETLDFQHDSYTWPLLCYMFLCCVFPLASASAHTFNTMSDSARHICFFVDYAALSSFSYGAALAYKAYVFPNQLRDTWFGINYINIALINAISCTLISCFTRFMQPSLLRKVLRLGAFAWPYTYDCIPVIYRLLFCDQSECQLTSQLQHTRQFVFAGIAAFLYSTHLPERLHPGKFDIIGHSHQLFHLSSILGTLDQMQGILYDMQERKSEMMDHWEFTSLHSSIGSLGAVMIINVCIIVGFSFKLRYSFLKQKIC